MTHDLSPATKILNHSLPVAIERKISTLNAVPEISSNMETLMKILRLFLVTLSHYRDIMNIRFILVSLIYLFLVFYSNPVCAGPAEDIADLEPGEWYEIPNSVLSEAGVFPVPLPPGTTGIKSIIAAWSGGVYDAKRDRLLIWGGGHADYAGNEIYAFDMNTYSWSRIWGPTPVEMIPTETAAYQAYPDGSPSSRHTYSNIAYIPEPYDLLYNHGGSVWKEPNLPVPYQATWLFNLTDLTWTDTGELPDNPNGKGSAVYDPLTRKVYARSKYGVYQYDLDNVQWSQVYRYGAGWWDFPSGDIDQVNRRIVYFGNCKMGVFDLTNFSYTHYTDSDFTGDTEIVCATEPGFAFDPKINAFVAWSGDLDKGIRPQDVYVIDPTNVVAEKRTPALSNTIIPSEASNWGTFGRFRYVPSHNIFVVVNSIYENVYVYRLSLSGQVQEKPPAPNELRVLNHDQ